MYLDYYLDKKLYPPINHIYTCYFFVLFFMLKLKNTSKGVFYLFICWISLCKYSILMSSVHKDE